MGTGGSTAMAPDGEAAWDKEGAGAGPGEGPMPEGIEWVKGRGLVDLEKVRLRNQGSTSSSGSGSEASTASASTASDATPRRQVLPFEAADRPDFGYLERLLREYEKAPHRRRPWRGGSQWCTEAPGLGPMHTLDLRHCPALADLVARVSKPTSGSSPVPPQAPSHPPPPHAALALLRRLLQGTKWRQRRGSNHPSSGSGLPGGVPSLSFDWGGASKEEVYGTGGSGGGSRGRGRSEEAVTFWAVLQRFTLKYHGIPQDLRARAWGLMGEALGLNYDTRLYALLAHGAIDECHRLQIDEALGSGHFAGLDVGCMRRVLMAYAAYNTKVGFGVGMSHVVGVLVRGDLSELCVFRLFFVLMENLGIADLYAHHTLALKSCVNVLEDLLSRRLRKVYKHLRAANITVEMLVCAWVPSLLCTVGMGDELVCALWDVLLACGCRHRTVQRAAPLAALLQLLFKLLVRSEKVLLAHTDPRALARFLRLGPMPLDAAGPPPPPSGFFPRTRLELFVLLPADPVSPSLTAALQRALARPRRRPHSSTCRSHHNDKHTPL